MTLDFRSMDDLCIRFAFFDAGTRAVYRTCISITLPSLGTPNASYLQSQKWKTSDLQSLSQEFKYRVLIKYCGFFSRIFKFCDLSLASTRLLLVVKKIVSQ